VTGAAVGPREDLDLPRAVARAGWSTLLPAHRASGEDLPVGAPFLVDTLTLDGAGWLAIVADDSWQLYPVPLVADGPAVRRAQPGDRVSEALLSLLGRGSRREGAFVITSWHDEPLDGERAVTVDQTNESVVVGERAVVKWSFRAEPGPHPAPTVLAELQARRFAGTPRPWGFVEWRPGPGAAPRVTVSVVSYLTDVSDGWTWAVDDLRQAVEEQTADPVVESGASAGELVGQLHVALAGHARPAAREEVDGWRQSAEADLVRALAVTRGPAHELLMAGRERISAALASGWAAAARGEVLVTRVHGDLHVGQLLRQPTQRQPAGGSSNRHRYVVTDFDGNPVVEPESRLALQPAALDVAGMVQSLHHVALVLLRHEPHHDPATVERMSRRQQQAFLAGYRATTAGAERRALLEPALVTPFRLQQVCREFVYAATHLPRWEYVPLGALPALLAEVER
jgi:maltokinase